MPVKGRIVAEKFRVLPDGTREYTGEMRVVEDAEVNPEVLQKLLAEQVNDTQKGCD